MKRLFLPPTILGWLLFVMAAGAGVNVQDLGIIGADNFDQTEAVQNLLDGGATDLYFPHGTYRLGTLSVKGGTRLEFAPGAVWKIEESRLVRKRLIDLKGNGISIEGLTVDFFKNKKDEFSCDELAAVVAGEDVQDLRFSGFRMERIAPYELQDPRDKANMYQSSPVAIGLQRCRNIEVSDCATKNIYALLSAKACANVSVHENRTEGGRYMTDFFDGSESLRHYHNWSSGTFDQIRWWGGDSNDRKPDTKGSRAEVVNRGLVSGQPGYHAEEIGVYEILIEGNYAEYGRSLGWGSKGRQIIFNANTARYMSDMAYDSEGGENVIFSNNISINSKTAGIGCYFWSEKVTLSGNQILVKNEGLAKYQGEFVRLQSLYSHPQGKTGAGQAVITGNLFSSEMENEPRHLSIEFSRDILITGNKFHNGSIVTKELSCGPLNIRGNDFTTTFAAKAPVIFLGMGAGDATLSGNIIRGGSSGGAMPGAAAIQLDSAVGQRKIVEDNQVFGWKKALQIRTMVKKSRPTDKPVRYLIQRNLFGGSVDLSGRANADTLIFSENRDPETLQLLQDPVPHGKSK